MFYSWFLLILGDDGYELVRGHSKRSHGGFERLTFSSSSKKHDPGYETVRDPPPLPRHHPGYIDPPYARLEKDEEESEEGYETIPASEQRKHSNDPGYETVPPKPDPGYETVPNVGQRNSPSNSKLIFFKIIVFKEYRECKYYTILAL